MSQPDEILLHIKIDGADLVPGEADHVLHLGLGGEPLCVQVQRQAGQEADPGGGVTPQPGVLPVTASGNLAIQLTEIYKRKLFHVMVILILVSHPYF